MRSTSEGPGVVGYLLGGLASLLVLAAEFVVARAGDVEGIGDVAAGFAVVLLVGAIPAALTTAVGAVALELLGLVTGDQRWHVLAAAVLGVLAGLLWSRGAVEAALMLGVAAGLGRLAVVPLRTRTHTTQPA